MADWARGEREKGTGAGGVRPRRSLRPAGRPCVGSGRECREGPRAEVGRGTNPSSAGSSRLTGAPCGFCMASTGATGHGPVAPGVAGLVGAPHCSTDTGGRHRVPRCLSPPQGGRALGLLRVAVGSGPRAGSVVRVLTLGPSPRSPEPRRRGGHPGPRQQTHGRQPGLQGHQAQVGEWFLFAPGDWSQRAWAGGSAVLGDRAPGLATHRRALVGLKGRAGPRPVCALARPRCCVSHPVGLGHRQGCGRPEPVPGRHGKGL